VRSTLFRKWVQLFKAPKADPRLAGLLIQEGGSAGILYPWSRVEPIAKSNNWSVWEEDGRQVMDEQGCRLRLRLNNSRLHNLAQRAQARWFRTQLRHETLTAC
jgi:hypothetical protein